MAKQTVLQLTLYTLLKIEDKIRGIVYDRFTMALGCIPNARYFPDSFLIGFALPQKIFF